ncbi:MAG: RNA polymerase sigma factor [Verrucomicrobiota bacterium]
MSRIGTAYDMTNQIQFEAFMRAYQNMVYTTAVRLLSNEAEAEDISQEVFLKAYERFEELGQSPTVGGWLKTVATNLCLNHLSRYRARWRFFSEMASGDDEKDSVVDLPAPETFAEQLNGADQRRLLEQALQKLPPAQRVPLVLYHFESKTYEEIALLLRISLSKVKTDIFRGREALRRKLQLAMGEEDWPGFHAGTASPRALPTGRRPDPFRKANRLLSPDLS